MSRYKIGSSMAFWAGAHETSMVESSDGDYVLHSEAQSEIARLQAEVERLKKVHDAVSDRAMRSDMRLIAARNDALEEAAKMVDCMADAAYDGGLSHHGQAEVTMNAIRALKRLAS